MPVRNYRMVLGDNAVNPITIPGTQRTYRTTVGTAITVPEFDFQTLASAGWVNLLSANSGCDVGTTANRPVPITVPIGFQYMDTSLNVVAVLAGVKSGWVNVATGAVV